MAVLGTLSSVNLIAGAGILGNVGGAPISANTNMVNAMTNYTAINVVSRFANIAASGYVSINIVANTLPALTNSIPTAYQGTLGSGTLTGAVNSWSNTILGTNNLGIFEQTLSAAQSFVSQTNQLIKTAINANNISVTLGSQDSISTGGVSDISQALRAFGTDLSRLGRMIDLNNLYSFGSPAALLKQIGDLANPTPALTTALLDSGIPAEIVDDLSNAEWTDQLQKLAYQAMTRVTGDDLAQILRLLRVTTPNITTLADLLNPFKTFPLSYNTLTAPTSQGLRGIYINTQGAVNTNLETTLPASVLAPLQGNPLQNLPRAAQ